MKLRTRFGVNDDLQAFAERWLDGARLSAQSLTHAEGALFACLHREGPYQVELVCVPAGFVIPTHVHPHADTIEVGVAGVLRLHVNGVDIFNRIPDEVVERMNHSRGIRINRSDAHGTAQPVGPRGAMFLSIQRWTNEPSSVLTDYVGRPGYRGGA